MAGFFVWAHRGASGVAPENTLAAFQEALKQGAHGIELDVHLSSDGIPVVIHDETVDRTTNGRGVVCDMPVGDLRCLDAGCWFDSRFAGEKIPLLSEVLDWAGDRLKLNLEIKAFAAGTKILELLPDFPKAEVVISSFQHRLLRRLRQSHATLPLAFLSDSSLWHLALRQAAQCGAQSWHPRIDRLSRAMLRQAHQRGLLVYPWTVDDPAQIRSLQQHGVDGVFTNFPDVAQHDLAGWRTKAQAAAEKHPPIEVNPAC